MSGAPDRVVVVLESDLVMRAQNLGMDHAEDQHHGKLTQRLYSGRDVARVLGVTEELSGEQYVALREAYSSGWSMFW